MRGTVEKILRLKRFIDQQEALGRAKLILYTDAQKRRLPHLPRTMDRLLARAPMGVMRLTRRERRTGVNTSIPWRLGRTFVSAGLQQRASRVQRRMRRRLKRR